MTVQQAMELALQHHQAGRLQQAQSLYQQVLSVQPQNPDALHLLGVVMHDFGDLNSAAALIGRAIQIHPSAAEFHNHLGLVLAAQKQFRQAEAAYSTALRHNPNFPEAAYGLGIALYHQGRLDEAIIAYERAIRLQPNFADAHNNLANAFRDKGSVRKAIEEYEIAIDQKPDDVEILSNLGGALASAGQLDRAISTLQHALELNPRHVDSLVHLGNALRDQAKLIDAMQFYRQAMQLAPDRPAYHSNLISTMLYEPSCTVQDVRIELQNFQQVHGEPRRASIRPHLNSRDPNRRLRVGYVSADFSEHASAFFFVPLLSNHHSSEFEITCYSNVARPDELTARMKSYVARWRDIHGLSDDRIAQMIREDQIDILVDAKVHTAENSLPVFARKPAPIQVTWLGQPASTGLETVDYRITDPYLDHTPAGPNDAMYCERSIYLPYCFWCYDPLTKEPAVNSLPAESAGMITFGCLNNFCKVNDEVLRLWSGLLQKVENSRLLLLSPMGKHREHVIEMLGIRPERVEFVDRQPRAQYLRLYHKIDIVLDTFPYNGHTTSFDALWMGVPIVTLPGQSAVSRGGLSLLSNLGHAELAGSTSDELIEIAANLAADRPRLAELRRTLRSRMEASPLMDGPRFARDFEAAFRQMWRRWCGAE